MTNPEYFNLFSVHMKTVREGEVLNREDFVNAGIIVLNFKPDSKLRVVDGDGKSHFVSLKKAVKQLKNIAAKEVVVSTAGLAKRFEVKNFLLNEEYVPVQRMEG